MLIHLSWRLGWDQQPHLTCKKHIDVYTTQQFNQECKKHVPGSDVAHQVAAHECCPQQKRTAEVCAESCAEMCAEMYATTWPKFWWTNRHNQARPRTDKRMWFSNVCDPYFATLLRHTRGIVSAKHLGTHGSSFRNNTSANISAHHVGTHSARYFGVQGSQLRCIISTQLEFVE